MVDHDHSKALDEAGRTLFRAFSLIMGVFLTGVVGYTIIGDEHNLLDAVYMTMISLTTVGYGETIDLTDKPGGRLFTIGLLVVGAGSFVYFFSNLTAFMVEGNLDRFLWRRKMKREIERLFQHYIVCGAGDTGEHVIKELVNTHRPFVLVDLDEERVKSLADRFGQFPAVIGDATDDEILAAAGIARARGIVAAVSNDKDNLLITVTAKLNNEHLRCVTRAIDEKGMSKARKAGADAVVSPNMIGGLRLVSELIRPKAVTFLDLMLRDKEKNLRIEDFTIEQTSSLVGKTVGSIRDLKLADVLIVALRHADGSWSFNPADELQLELGDGLVFMGNPDGRKELQRLGSGAMPEEPDPEPERDESEDAKAF